MGGGVRDSITTAQRGYNNYNDIVMQTTIGRLCKDDRRVTT